MKTHRVNGWLELLLGVVMIALGIWMMANPDKAIGVLAWLFGFGAVLSGIADIALYVRLERRTGFAPGIALASGILSVLVGVMFWAFPEAGRWSLTLLFPVWFIARSISRLGNLGLIRLMGGDATYYVSLALGILGFILGLVMLFNPMLSIVYISVFAAVYLIITGAASIWLGITWLKERGA